MALLHELEERLEAYATKGDAPYDAPAVHDEAPDLSAVEGDVDLAAVPRRAEKLDQLGQRDVPELSLQHHPGHVEAHPHPK